MESSPKSIDKVIETFKTEFKPIIDKFEIIKVLNGNQFSRKNVLGANQKFIYYQDYVSYLNGPDKEYKFNCSSIGFTEYHSFHRLRVR
jgi:hypothetical protein